MLSVIKSNTTSDSENYHFNQERKNLFDAPDEGEWNWACGHERVQALSGPRLRFPC